MVLFDDSQAALSAMALLPKVVAEKILRNFLLGYLSKPLESVNSTTIISWGTCPILGLL
jgi:hypothetical protein